MLYGGNGVDALYGEGGVDSFVQIAQITGTTGLNDEEALETSGNLITI